MCVKGYLIKVHKGHMISVTFSIWKKKVIEEKNVKINMTLFQNPFDEEC